MKIVLVDTCAVRCVRNRHNFSLDEVPISLKIPGNDSVTRNLVSEMLGENNTNDSNCSENSSHLLKCDLIYKGSVSGGITLWMYELHLRCSSGNGNVLKKLRDRFDKDDDVKISVYLKSIPSAIENGNETRGDTIVSATGMKIDKETYTCVGSTTRLNPTHFERLGNSNGNNNLRMTIITHIPDMIASEVRTEIPINQRILEEEIASDVVITAGNGKEIRAHKCFLFARSPVIQTIFSSGFKESQTGKLDMTDMSEEGINAFLRYIYYGDLTGPKENIEDAYELLYAAHKYNVPKLESLMITYLMEMGDDDFWEELALRIYTFVRTIESCKELKRKTVRILKSKLDALEALSEYKELFQKSPDAAMELCKNLAKTTL